MMKVPPSEHPLLPFQYQTTSEARDSHFDFSQKKHDTTQATQEPQTLTEKYRNYLKSTFFGYRFEYKHLMKDPQLIEHLVELGLHVCFVCSDGVGRSVESAMTYDNFIESLNHRAVSSATAIKELVRLKKSGDEKYDKLLEAFSKIPVVVILSGANEFAYDSSYAETRKVILEIQEKVEKAGGKPYTVHNSHSPQMVSPLLDYLEECVYPHLEKE